MNSRSIQGSSQKRHGSSSRGSRFEPPAEEDPHMGLPWFDRRLDPRPVFPPPPSFPTDGGDHVHPRHQDTLEWLVKLQMERHQSPSDPESGMGSSGAGAARVSTFMLSASPSPDSPVMAILFCDKVSLCESNSPKKWENLELPLMGVPLIPTSAPPRAPVPPRTRIRWTQELHERFVEAVGRLGGADSESG